MLEEKSLSYWFLQRLAHFLYRKAWLVTGQSQEIVTEIKQQVPASSAYHLSNGVDTNEFHPAKASKRIREQYLRQGEVGFLYAGLHGLFQGLDQIITAAERLKGEAVRFVLIGDGPEKHALVNAAQDLRLTNVDFYPPVPHKQMPSILASMDVALITLKTAIRGAVPSKIYEAMASAVPILLVAEGEAAQIVWGKGVGLTVVPGDIDSIVRSIHQMTFNARLRISMGQAGRQAAECYYDRGKIVRGFEAVLVSSK
jgi:glycosyltransferase involved in cell wall biosynthesis